MTRRLTKMTLHHLASFTLLLFQYYACCLADEYPMPVQTFVTSVLEGHYNGGDTMWLINEGTDEFGDELLFIVDNSPLQEKCARGCPEGQECPNMALLLIGYYRPGAIERFCLWEDGYINSIMSRRQLQAATITPAPVLRDLVALIDARGPLQTCVPPAHRGILFETMELLCFAMGHKPAVIRQRQVHNPNAGHSTLSVLQGVPANLFVPHTRTILQWLLANPAVWRGVSRVQWDVEDRVDPPFEHAMILAHTRELAQHLIDLNVQDASVPHQETIEATSNYIAHVGAALGYSRDEIRVYLETSGVVPETDNAEERQKMFDTSLALAFEDGDCNDDTQECEPKQQQSYPELEGFREFLESEPATHLSPYLFRQLVEPIDELFMV